MPMKKTIHLFFLVFLLGACFSAQAQTTKKKTTTQSTTKKASTTTKKTTATKKGKTAAKGKVLICDGVNGYTFHSRRTCAELAKCKGRVLEVTKQEAMGDWGRKQCKVCY